jgi:hypothetical protein
MIDPDALILACDPDLHTSGLALVRVADGMPTWVGCAKSAGKTGDDAVVEQLLALRVCGFKNMPNVRLFNAQFLIVESQEIVYSARQGINPRSMIPVAQVAGGAMAVFSGLPGLKDMYLVKPQAWKGDVPKHIHQARTMVKLGWPFEKCSDYCHPLETPDVPGADWLNKGDWKHVVDAIALGMWLAEKLRGLEIKQNA